MVCYRITVVVLLALITACMTCSLLFPLFRKYDFIRSSSAVQRSAFYYWYVEVAQSSSSGLWTVQRLYTRALPCDEMRVFFIWASALTVAAAGFGGLATLLGAAWISVGYSVALSVEVFLLTFLAMACSAAALGLTAYEYAAGTCMSSAGLRSDDFTMVEGFVLLCVAVAGFLVLTVMQAIGFCCGCQTGKRVQARKVPEEEVSHEPVEPRVRDGAAHPRQTVVMAQDASSMYAGTGVAPPRTATTTTFSDGHYPYPQKN